MRTRKYDASETRRQELRATYTCFTKRMPHRALRKHSRVIAYRISTLCNVPEAAELNNRPERESVSVRFFALVASLKSFEELYESPTAF